MTKADLIRFLSEKTGSNQKLTSKAIDTILDGMREALGKGEAVTIIGFGTLKVVERSERQGRNPRTGEVILIPAQKSVRFSVGKGLKEELNPAHAEKKGKKK
jgi:DNA-binding protein HU-beta